MSGGSRERFPFRGCARLFRSHVLELEKMSPVSLKAADKSWNVVICSPRKPKFRNPYPRVAGETMRRRERVDGTGGTSMEFNTSSISIYPRSLKVKPEVKSDTRPEGTFYVSAKRWAQVA